MHRREALKSIAASTGMLASSGTIMSLLLSCQQQLLAGVNWVPLFLDEKEAIAVSSIVDIILPAGKTPGAVDMAVPQFIDLLYHDVFQKQDGEKLKRGLTVFSQRFEEKYHLDFYDTPERIKQEFILGLYQLPKEKVQQILNLVKMESAPAENENFYFLYSFLTTLRELTVNVYFTSEHIGEEVLDYDPIPGGYEGCVPIGESDTNWSLR